MLNFLGPKEMSNNCGKRHI